MNCGSVYQRHIKAQVWSRRTQRTKNLTTPGCDGGCGRSFGRTMKLHLYPETKGRELFKKGYKSQLRCVKKRYEHAKIIKTKGFVWELGNNMSTQTPNNKVDKGAKPSNGRANTPHLIDQTPLTARLHLDFKPDQHGGLFRNWSLFISTRWKILRTCTVTDTPPKHDATTTVRYCEGCN